MRVIELFQCLVEFDQLSVKFQLGKHLTRKAAQCLCLFKCQLMRFEIHDTQRPQRMTFVGYKRHAAIEFEVRFARDSRDLVESGIFAQIRRYDHLAATNRGCAECDFARTLVKVRRKAILGFEPETIVVHQADIGYGALANLCSQFANVVIGDLGRGIEDIERSNGSKPFRLVGGR
uniref:hypothetical protein n=1 Tax=unclassified Mesorhizobium TaxID=325217 RepID=UPI001FD5525C|nr:MULTISPECIES: hypothetical protein [unclassified Mesorhizobium]